MIMNWTAKYDNDFTDQFNTEQDFIDAKFILIIMESFGVWVKQENLLMREGRESMYIYESDPPSEPEPEPSEPEPEEPSG